MIQIHVNPARVEKIVFIFESEMESDFDLATWLAIQSLVKKINRTLRIAVSGSLSASQKDRKAELKTDSCREDRR